MQLSDGYVPLARFGRDHWSTLAYAETVMVECGGFQIGFDGRMRQGRQHFRVMREQCPKPRRPTAGGSHGVPMDLKYSTPLKDGAVVEGHDDWHCVQDMAHAGFFHALVGSEVITEQVAAHMEPGVILSLSPLGCEAADALRAHKRGGGSFGNFTWVPEMAAA